MTYSLWLVAALSMTPIVAKAPRPVATQRYKLDVKTTQVVNLAALGQGEQRVEITGTGWVTVNSTDSAGGQALKVVLDSLKLGEGCPIPPDQAKAASGATWTGYRQPNDRVMYLKHTSENNVAASIEGVLQQLFPPIKPGTGAGKTWTDTTEMTREGGVAIRTVTNFQTTSDSYNGQKVLKLAGASSSAISGSQ